MEHRDRDLILAGAWNRKAGGHEATLRRFAQAFRELPPTELTDVAVTGGDAVKVRQTSWQGKTYVSVLNLSPFSEAPEVLVDGAARPFHLAPFAMQTLVLDGSPKVTARVRTSASYQKEVSQRLTQFQGLLTKLSALDPASVGAQYAAHAATAEGLLRAGHVHAADLALGYGLPAELSLRLRLLKPDSYLAARVAVAPRASDSLEAWDKKALDINVNNGSFFGAHLYFPNTWSGPKDLSARVRMAHDGHKLYVGVKVADSVLNARDGLTLWFSRANYRNWREERAASRRAESELPGPRRWPPREGRGHRPHLERHPRARRLLRLRQHRAIPP